MTQHDRSGAFGLVLGRIIRTIVHHEYLGNELPNLDDHWTNRRGLIQAGNHRRTLSSPIHAPERRRMSY